MQQLEDEDLVTSEQGGGKRTYRFTEAGKQELKNEAETTLRIWKRAEQRPGVPGSVRRQRRWRGRAAEVMKAALGAATRASHESARIAKIREILERTTGT